MSDAKPLTDEELSDYDDGWSPGHRLSNALRKPRYRLEMRLRATIAAKELDLEELRMDLDIEMGDLANHRQDVEELRIELAMASGHISKLLNQLEYDKRGCLQGGVDCPGWVVGVDTGPYGEAVQVQEQCQACDEREQARSFFEIVVEPFDLERMTEIKKVLGR